MSGSLQQASSTTEPLDTFGEAYEAAKTFDADFNFRKMDQMIHRFPLRLGEIISSKYPYMVAPTFVAIGPYHRESEHVVKMEAVKKAAAHLFLQSSKNLRGAVKKAADHYKRGVDAATTEVVKAVNKARTFYYVTGGMTEDEFADMMIYDACFLLLYMDVYNRSQKGEEEEKGKWKGKGKGKGEGERKWEDYVLDPSMRRFLFSHRDRINNDIMLLENQLPWGVIQVFIDLAKDDHQDMKRIVGFFIAAMGSSFKISQSSYLYLYEYWKNHNPPPHLLALLLRHQTEAQRSSSKKSEPQSSRTSIDIIDGFKLGNRDEVVVSAISPVDLDQIGIKLAADPTEKFSDMALERGWFWSRLKLAPLSLDDTGASWLVNMAAFEVCTASSFDDDPVRTAVCSYLALLAFFMAGSDDVRKLRLMGLLKGPNTDDDMLAFFQTLQKHLPDYGAHFTKVMEDVEEYKRNRRIWTTLYRWVYNNWKTVVSVVSIIVAVATTIAALIRLYQELRSVIHKN